MPYAPLKLRLAGLPVGHSTYRGQLEFVGLDAAEEEEPYSIGVVCEVDNLGTRIVLRGEVRGHARSTCHRCLRQFARPVETQFDLTLGRGGAAAASEDLVAVPENAAEYDLEPDVREAVLLEEPIRSLCSADCKGLCSQCGADLNQGACGCGPAADPRWAPLERLREPDTGRHTDP